MPFIAILCCHSFIHHVIVYLEYQLCAGRFVKSWGFGGEPTYCRGANESYFSSWDAQRKEKGARETSLGGSMIIPFQMGLQGERGHAVLKVTQPN